MGWGLVLSVGKKRTKETQRINGIYSILATILFRRPINTLENEGGYEKTDKIRIGEYKIHKNNST